MVDAAHRPIDEFTSRPDYSCNLHGAGAGPRRNAQDRSLYVSTTRATIP
jgi:hypothetical protein